MLVTTKTNLGTILESMTQTTNHLYLRDDYGTGKSTNSNRGTGNPLNGRLKCPGTENAVCPGGNQERPYGRTGYGLCPQCC